MIPAATPTALADMLLGAEDGAGEGAVAFGINTTGAKDGAENGANVLS